MILKELIKISLIGPCIFKYKNIEYNNSNTIIEDFIEDGFEYLIYKKVTFIYPTTTENGISLIVKLED